MKIIFIFAAALCAVSSNTCNKKQACVGTPIKDCVCAQVYQPVCGCDGKTYSNACVAKCAGVKSWEEGECPTKR